MRWHRIEDMTIGEIRCRQIDLYGLYVAPHGILGFGNQSLN